MRLCGDHPFAMVAFDTIDATAAACGRLFPAAVAVVSLPYGSKPQKGLRDFGLLCTLLPS